MGAQELSFPALLPKEPYDATNRWTDYGPNIFRLQDRKGGDYLLGPTHEEMFTLVVKDLYSSYKDLPLSIYQIQNKYRDEARPRAGPAARARVRDEGLLLLRHRRRRARAVLPAAPRRLHPDLRPARLRVRHRQGDVRRDGRLGQRGVPRQGRGRRGHLRPLHPLRLRRQRRGRHRPRARRGRRTTTRPPRTRRTRPTPRPSTPWSTTSTRPSRATTAPGRPATPSRTCSSCSSTPTARASRSPSACPATARSTRSASRASSSPSRSRRWTRPSSPSTPRWSRATSDPEALGEDSKSGIRFLVDPRIVEGTRWVTGANVPGSHVIDMVVGRDFTPDGTIEAADVRDGDTCPNCLEGIARVRPRHRDGPHLPARPQLRRGPRAPGARRERQARDRHDGLLRHRPVARGRRHRRGHPRRQRPLLAAQRRPRRRPRRRRRQGRRDLRVRRVARRRPVRARASRCSTTTAAARSAPA